LSASTKKWFRIGILSMNSVRLTDHLHVHRIRMTPLVNPV